MSVQDDLDAPLVVPARPPREWFESVPDWFDADGSLVQIDFDSGRVAALVAPYGECILDGGQNCWTPPESKTGYEYAHVGTILTADGEKVRIANVGGSVPHASLHASASVAQDHYANTATRRMIGRYMDSPEHGGIVFVGSMWPGTTQRDALEVMTSALSGDWRYIASLKGYEMVGAQLVNNPGFRPVPRAKAAAAFTVMLVSPKVAAAGSIEADRVIGEWVVADTAVPSSLGDIAARLQRVSAAVADLLDRGVSDDDDPWDEVDNYEDLANSECPSCRGTGCQRCGWVGYFEGHTAAMVRTKRGGKLRKATRAVRDATERLNITRNRKGPGGKGGFDALGHWHDPGTGEFAPKGHISVGQLRALLSSRGDTAAKARKAIQDEARREMGANRNIRRDELVAATIGPRPDPATDPEGVNGWWAAFRYVSTEYAKVQAERQRVRTEARRQPDTKIDELKTPVRDRRAESPEARTRRLSAEAGMDQSPGDSPEGRAEYEKELARLRAGAATLPPPTAATANERAAALDDLFGDVRDSPLDTSVRYNRQGKDGKGWSAEREELHQRLLDEAIARVKRCGVPQERKAAFLAGLPGAGKSSSLAKGGAAERLNMQALEIDAAKDGCDLDDQRIPYVAISADSFKVMLAEEHLADPSAGVMADIDGLRPLEHSMFSHAESQYLAREFERRLLAEGYNVVHDGTMGDSINTRDRLTRLEMAGYDKPKLLVADISGEESAVSTAFRYSRQVEDELGGRFISKGVSTARTDSSSPYRSTSRDVAEELIADDKFGDYVIVNMDGISTGGPKAAKNLVVAERIAIPDDVDTVTEERTVIDGKPMLPNGRLLGETEFEATGEWPWWSSGLSILDSEFVSGGGGTAANPFVFIVPDAESLSEEEYGARLADLHFAYMEVLGNTPFHVVLGDPGDKINARVNAANDMKMFVNFVRDQYEPFWLRVTKAKDAKKQKRLLDDRVAEGKLTEAEVASRVDDKIKEFAARGEKLDAEEARDLVASDEMETIKREVGDDIRAAGLPDSIDLCRANEMRGAGAIQNPYCKSPDPGRRIRTDMPQAASPLRDAIEGSPARPPNAEKLSQEAENSGDIVVDEASGVVFNPQGWVETDRAFYDFVNRLGVQTVQMDDNGEWIDQDKNPVDIDLDPRRLKPTQTNIDAQKAVKIVLEDVRPQAAKGGKAPGTILVYKGKDGEYRILDGHHRAMAYLVDQNIAERQGESRGTMADQASFTIIGDGVNEDFDEYLALDLAVVFFTGMGIPTADLEGRPDTKEFGSTAKSLGRLNPEHLGAFLAQDYALRRPDGSGTGFVPRISEMMRQEVVSRPAGEIRALLEWDAAQPEGRRIDPAARDEFERALDSGRRPTRLSYGQARALPGVVGGTGEKDDPFMVDDVESVAQLLAETDYYVSMELPGTSDEQRLGFLLDEVTRLSAELDRIGENPLAVIDLCRLVAPNTSVGCGTSVEGKFRRTMPQFAASRSSVAPDSVASGKPPATRDDGSEEWPNILVDYYRELDRRAAARQGVPVDQMTEGASVATTMKAKGLRVSQTEVNAAKVREILQEMRELAATGRDPLSAGTIVVADDGYIIDGHHRAVAAQIFAAERGLDLDVPVVAIRDYDSIVEALDDSAVFAAMMGIPPQDAAGAPDMTFAETRHSAARVSTEILERYLSEYGDVMVQQVKAIIEAVLRDRKVESKIAE